MTHFYVLCWPSGRDHPIVWNALAADTIPQAIGIAAAWLFNSRRNP